MRSRSSLAGIVFVCWLFALGPALRAEDSAAVEKRLREAVKYLASDALEGRGVETKGLGLAADYIAAKFAEAGLKTNVLAGTPFQKFSVTTSGKRGPNNSLAFLGPSKDPAKPERIELKLDEDFTPMAIGGSGSFDLPLMFLGYGITGEAEKYDDYAGLDVKGKAVVILRHEPQQADAKSVFNGASPSYHSYFSRKVTNAQQHGASVVILCSDDFDVQKAAAEARKKWREALDRLAEEHARFTKNTSPTPEQYEAARKRIDELTLAVIRESGRIRSELDPVLSFEAAGQSLAGPPTPVVYCRRSILDRILRAATKTDLASIERKIDADLKPQSAELAGWRVTGETQIERSQTEVRNVVAVLEGEGPTAEETIVIGAHYDHLGYGAPGPVGRPRTIHYGADDNASGTAVMLEIAREMAQRKEKLQRRLVFVAFAGEELGILGSNHYIAHPPFPVEKTVAMLNLDMVGRLRENRLHAIGCGTSPRFPELLDSLGPRFGLAITKIPTAVSGSDHLPFYGRKIPVLHFFTGVHSEYHRPGDVADKINFEGMRRVTGLVAEMTVALASDAKRPEYGTRNLFLQWLLRQMPADIALPTLEK